MEQETGSDLVEFRELGSGNIFVSAELVRNRPDLVDFILRHTGSSRLTLTEGCPISPPPTEPAL